MFQPNNGSINRTILIIDDHVLFREGLSSLLRSTPGFQLVGGAGSVHEGIEMARRLRPDIVLMDFSLPDGTGLDATRAILAECPECKIVFLTVNEGDEDLFAAIRSGAKGYLLKNIAAADMIASLRALDRDELALSRKMMNRIVHAFSITDQRDDTIGKLIDKLSARELEILREVQSGASNSEIARRLYLSENTVKHHIHNIFEKLGIENRREAIRIANRADHAKSQSG